jgi:putative glycosyl hydrolase
MRRIAVVLGVVVLLATGCASPGAAWVAPTPSVTSTVSRGDIPPSTTTPAGATPTTAAVRALNDPVRTAKKGVSVWDFDGFTKALGDSGASWYFDWAAGPGKFPAPSGVEFVPMIWGDGSVTKSNLDKAKASGRVLLGFNEPDLAGQANMTVERALALWPLLQATGLRLGSPAPAWGAADPGRWFDRFMQGVADKGYRVDFIALHWYGSDFSAAATGQLKSYLQAVYNRYHKPIWLTEYALINFSGGTKYPTQAQQAAFATKSVQMLEGLPFVERYAWFALPAADGSDTGLYQPGGGPTGVGSAYRTAS